MENWWKHCSSISARTLLLMGMRNLCWICCFWHYTENNQIDNEKIKTQFAKLRDYLNLPPQEYDEVFYIVGDLCIEHSRLAFREGMGLVFALMQELKC